MHSHKAIVSDRRPGIVTAMGRYEHSTIITYPDAELAADGLV